MITLNITIGGNLLIELEKGAKKELKELIEKASNTDAILTDLLEAGNYLGNGYEETTGVLTEAPIIGFNSIFNEDDELVDYEKCWYYNDYQIKSFATELLNNGKVVFTKVD